MVEAEYFLLEELKFNLLVFHPYRPMERYIKDANLPDLLQDACAYCCASLASTTTCPTPVLSRARRPCLPALAYTKAY